MSLDPKHCIKLLRDHLIQFKALSSIGEEEFRWRPNESSWSILEVICHLRDEEIEDFRTRLAHILSKSEGDPPGIDPEAWVKERDYQAQEPAKVLVELIARRNDSIEWLEQLSEPNWDQTYEHPFAGTLLARQFLHNWAAHDLLHLRQILKIRHGHLRQVGGISLDYAGKDPYSD